MKKTVLFILILSLVLLAGCATALPSQAPATAEPTLEPTVEPIVVEGKTISPLPSSIDVSKLSDCTVHVGFDASDIYLEDDSRLVICLTLYDSELFDLVDISMMEPGDTLLINGEKVLINSLEVDEYGTKYINGGYENGGICLATEETGVFFEVRENSARSYYPLGRITLPVDQDFLYRDCSDIEHGETVYYPGDLITDISQSSRYFDPHSTTVTIIGDRITELSSVYMP